MIVREGDSMRGEGVVECMRRVSEKKVMRGESVSVREGTVQCQVKEDMRV